MSETIRIRSPRRVGRLNERHLSVSALGVCLVACLAACLVACSKGSSDGGDAEKETSSETTQPAAAAEGDDESVDAGDASVEAFDPEVLIRRLDRLVAGTDAHVLRSGLEEVAASALLSLDVLEVRFQSAQSRLRELRPSTSAEAVSR